MGLWKTIKKDVGINSRTSFLVGNERKVKFWYDKWCGDKSLCVSFPSWYALVLPKEVWMVDL